MDGGVRATANGVRVDGVTAVPPGGPGAWHVRTEIDPEGSQGAWFRAALLADELELAHRIATTPVVAGSPRDPDPEADLHRAALVAEGLVVLGRGAEATEVLRERGVRPPRPGEPVSWPQALLAAGQAATGDPGAWAWLTARTTDVSEGFRLRLVRLVAAAAEQRGDLGVADAAWADVPGLTGAMSSPRLAGRAAMAAVLRRNREAEPRALAAVVSDAFGALQSAAGDDAATCDAALDVAERLEARGDRAGARLLLRAARAGVPRDRRLVAALRRLRPRPTGAAVLARVGIAVAVASVIAVGAATGARAVAPVGGLLLGAVIGLVPITGFTRPESQVWRGMRTLRYDPALGRADTSGATGWYGLAAILGFAVTFIAVAVALTALGRGGAWPGWAVSSAGLLGIVVVLAAGSAGALLGARSIRHAVGRRTLARRRAADHGLAEQRATVCRCGDVDVTWGRDGRLYAERHLVATAARPPVEVPGGELRVCPVSAMPWLVGPLGIGGRHLALRGAIREVPDDAGAQSPAGGEAPTGFYL